MTAIRKRYEALAGCLTGLKQGPPRESARNFVEALRCIIYGADIHDARTDIGDQGAFFFSCAQGRLAKPLAGVDALAALDIADELQWRVWTHEGATRLIEVVGAWLAGRTREIRDDRIFQLLASIAVPRRLFSVTGKPFPPKSPVSHDLASAPLNRFSSALLTLQTDVLALMASNDDSVALERSEAIGHPTISEEYRGWVVVTGEMIYEGEPHSAAKVATGDLGRRLDQITLELKVPFAWEIDNDTHIGSLLSSLIAEGLLVIEPMYTFHADGRINVCLNAGDRFNRSDIWPLLSSFDGAAQDMPTLLVHEYAEYLGQREYLHDRSRRYLKPTRPI